MYVCYLLFAAAAAAGAGDVLASIPLSICFKAVDADLLVRHVSGSNNQDVTSASFTAAVIKAARA
jgi:hypothetical protein